jgi:hypothetical protein
MKMRNLTIILLLVILQVSVFAISEEVTASEVPSSEVEISSIEAKAGNGPIRIVDFPLVFPSPFSVIRDKKVVIQYTLSEESNIDILIIGASGEIIKKFSFQSGEEGGMAALNQVVWDGKPDWGNPIGNGIYLGIIVSRDKNKVLGNFKLTAYN